MADLSTVLNCFTLFSIALLYCIHHIYTFHACFLVHENFTYCMHDEFLLLFREPVKKKLNGTSLFVTLKDQLKKHHLDK